MQQAARPNHAPGLRDSDALRYAIAALAWVIGLWLVAPAGLADWRALAARGVALLIIGFGGQMLLRAKEAREPRPQGTWLLLLLMLLLAMADVRLARWGLARLLPLDSARFDPLYVAPHAFVPLLVAMLYGGQTALVVGLTAGVAVALAAGFDLAVFLLSLSATAVAAYEASALRYRSQIARTLGRIALWQTPIVLVMTLMNPDGTDLRTVGIRIGALVLWLAVSGMLVILALPPAERLTRRISDYSLNGFADLGQPLLRRMALEAPGTYHHSMMVADLAQAAAERIGGNGLLARVGAYFHDIGKLGRPRFYMENQMQGGNPHDALPPNISRMIIVNHVKEGLVMARLHHLPGVVARFIAVHHGTSVIRWFLHKAVNQAGAPGGDGAGGADESHYRYAGPLPVSREETIVALADSVEAAARALPRVTPGHLENLVNAIFKAKWSDGQLDASLLSNAELARVRASFVFTLTHLLHARLAYPSHEPNPDPPSIAAASG
jgi:putative nucleotidyltransferase with HDIG domain